ncbi:MAG: hypothetical protein ACM3P1_07230 [Candidatus Saccharibacteria bacterium]
MKTKIGLLLLALCLTMLNVNAQRRVITTTRAMSYDISDNLDLDAVASIFGDSRDLEDFEYRLNDPDNRISNLDLNGDGYIDYLRVVENSSDRNSLIVIQAVLDQDVYQDVATIEVEKVRDGRLRVQVVGDAYIYGNDYIIEPVYVGTPLIFSFFWGPHYRPYYSPYYWNYYPRWYSYYEPCSTYKYHRHIYRHINSDYEYHHTTNRFIHFSDDRYNQIRRSDYASRYPDRSFSRRNEGVNNRYELERRRPTDNNITGRGRNWNTDRINSDGSYENKRGMINGNNMNYDDIYDNTRRSSSGNSVGSNRERIRSNDNTDNNSNMGNSSNDRPYVRPENRSGGERSRIDQNSNVENNRRSNSSEAPVQMKSGRINEPGNGGSVQRSRPMSSSGSNRSGNQVDSRTSTPRERSGSVMSRSNRVNNEVKQEQRDTRRQESPQREENRENGNGRRR